MVLAGGASQRFPPDKLAQLVDGEPLLDRTLASLPEDFVVVVVGPVRQVPRPVIFTSEDPPGGGPAAAMIAGLRRALAESADVIVVLLADAPLGGQAASTLLGRLEDEPSTAAAVGIDVYGREQPLQLALRPAAARALLAGAGPGGAAGVSARRLLDALRPGLMSQELAPAELWDIDGPDQLIAWRLRSSSAVSSILELAIERRPGAERPVVIAIDGPSCAGKSILATALALRSEGAVLEGDDFYRQRLPRLTVTQRETMSDSAVVNAVIDWERLRAEALLPLRAGRVGHVPALRLGCPRRPAGAAEDHSSRCCDHCGRRLRRTARTGRSGRCCRLPRRESSGARRPLCRTDRRSGLAAFLGAR